MTPEDPLEPPKRTRGDLAHTATKTILGMMSGGVAGEIFAALLSPPLQRRGDEWKEEVVAVLRRLEKDRGVKIEELQADDAFIDAVLHATQIAIRTSSGVKREALRAAIFNAGLANRPDASVQHILLGLIDELSELHILVLSVFHDPTDWCRRHNIELRAMTPNQVLEQALPNLRGRRVLYDHIWHDLRTRGLVTLDNLHVTATGPGSSASRTSELGDLLLEFITTGVDP